MKPAQLLLPLLTLSFAFLAGPSRADEFAAEERLQFELVALESGAETPAAPEDSEAALLASDEPQDDLYTVCIDLPWTTICCTSASCVSF